MAFAELLTRRLLPPDESARRRTGVIAQLRALTPDVMPDLHFRRNAKQRELWLSDLRLAMGETS